MSGFEREGFSFRHCIQNVWVVVTLVSGKGEMECQGRTIQIGPGTVYVIPPGIPFYERNTGDCAWGFACLFLHISGKSGIIPTIPENRASTFEGGFDVAGRMMDVVRALHFRPAGFELKAIGGTLMILSAVAERVDGGTRQGYSTATSKALEVLGGNVVNPPNIPKLAKLCNVSVSLLSHQFKKETGYSPMEYARRERVKAGKEFILAGSSVEDAASRLGFSSPFHFSRMFSRIEGRPPSYFRKLAGRKITSWK
ncbi:MAG: helix-turn-helix domain-containing protein [Victivallales bacterium]|nr:helix-turn-helix domain-containing protein [Victivallales bacterium]